MLFLAAKRSVTGLIKNLVKSMEIIFYALDEV